MDIRNIRGLKDTAAQRLAGAAQAERIVLIYAVICTGSAILVTVLNFVLGELISRVGGGLSTMGLRSALSTVQSVLPILQSCLMVCLELGYAAAMLRISRGQYTSPQTLRAGMPRFWAMLRCYLIQGMMYFGVCMGAFYIGTMIYTFTPMFRSAVEAVTPAISQLETIDPVALAESGLADQVIKAMIPMIIMVGLLIAAGCIPLSYSFRQATFVLLDDPRAGAMMALRESTRMMRGNRLALFRVDLSYWWYYALALLMSVVAYLDMLLPRLGIALPFSEDVGFFLFYGLSLAIQFVVILFLQNRVQTTYALAYQAVRPPEPEQTGGVVLGNIFQM